MGFWIAVLAGLLAGPLLGVLVVKAKQPKAFAFGLGAVASVVTFVNVWFAMLFGFPQIELILAGSVGAAIVIALFTKLGGGSHARTLGSAGVGFVLAFLINWWYLTLDMPQFTGTLGGYNWFICMNLVFCIIVGVLSAMSTASPEGDRYSRNRRFDREDPNADKVPQKRDRGGLTTAVLSGVAFALLVVWGIGNSMYYSIGAGNKVYYSQFLKVRMAGPEDKLPVTDVSNMREVPADVAGMRAQNSLSNNASYSSLYKVDCDELVAQEIDGHLWSVAPLEYQNNWSQRGWPGSTYAPNSPGYVRVDLQAANGVGELVTGSEYELNYFPSAMLEKNLYRHIYQAGYTNGIIDDVTLEVTDKDQHRKPYYTATFNYYEVGVDGERIRKVLLIDAKTGAIQEFDLGKTPEWVDRVVSTRLRDRYVNDYLAFGWHKEALEGYSWYAGGHGNQFKILDDRLMMDAGRHHPTSLITVTSNDNTNTAIVGVMACATNNNDCVMWPEMRLQQANHAADSCTTLMASRRLVGRVDRMQPYIILDRMTWMAPIAQNNGTGLAGFCLIDATPGNASASNGAVASDLRSAVYQYGLRLDAEVSANDPEHARGGANRITLTGVIYRIGVVTFNSEIRYEILMSKDGKVVPMVFLANPQNVPAALLKEGETVTITYNAVEHTAQPDLESIVAPSLKDVPAALLRLGTDTGAPAAVAAPAAPKQ